MKWPLYWEDNTPAATGVVRSDVSLCARSTMQTINFIRRWFRRIWSPCRAHWGLASTPTYPVLSGRRGAGAGATPGASACLCPSDPPSDRPLVHFSRQPSAHRQYPLISVTRNASSVLSDRISP
ncbi:hypothetical protein A0H81_14743 [Grifola frondosa]|uniref:Uncharacterized protein n=1 Tax=Grifola frondosa TaxID=5627 RepID=A0A1C7LKL7_GRIFR|nr:hypothetical protein A0H81_14743 [Grifola frondosa]